MVFTSNNEEIQVNRVAQHASNSPLRRGHRASLEARARRRAGSSEGFRLGLATSVVRGVALLLAVAGVASCAAGVARAEDIHLAEFALGEIPQEGPHGEAIVLPGPLQKMESMIVDSGHLWVAEELSATQSRIDEFDAATGAFLGQPVHAESATPYSEGYGESYGTGIAVGHGPGQPVVFAAGKAGGQPVVSVFSEAGVLVKTWTGASTPSHSFGGEVSGVAVDNSTSPLDEAQGDVYVAVASQDVIDVFHPEASGEERYIGQITGTAPSEPFGYPHRVAVNETTGEVVVQDNRNGPGTERVDVLKPGALGTYELAHTISGTPGGTFGEVWTLAVDSESGDIYVAEFPAKQPYRVDQFSATGTYLGQIANVAALDPWAIAVDPTSHHIFVRSEVYGPDVVIPDVATTAAASVKPESVTLNGTVDPDGAGNATCEFEWGTSTAFGNTVPCSEGVPNGEGAVEVHASLTGLARDTTYYYRLQATNANGTNPGEASQDQQVSTIGLIIRDGSVTNVGASSATFEGTIDPGATSTSYYFQYGITSAYGQQTPAAPGEAIGSGTSDVEVPAHTVQGLSPSTLYHYRLVAVSEIAPGEFETIDGPDRTFTTQAARGSVTAMDGRQWQMVSPPRKLGALIEGSAGFNSEHEEAVMQASAAGDAIAYRASSPTESEPKAGYARSETVLSTRGPEGWSTQDISPPAEVSANFSEATGREFQIFSEDLSRAAVQPLDSSFTALAPEASESTAYLRTDYFNGNVSERCEGSYKSAASCFTPLVSAADDTADPFQPFGEEPNGSCEYIICGVRFQGGDSSLDHVVVSSPAQLTSTPAPAGSPGLYEWSAGTLQLLDVLPPGEEGAAVLAGTTGARASAIVGVRHAVSDGGARIVMERVIDVPSGGRKSIGLYLRDVAAGETIRLDVPQGGSGSGYVSYMDANGEASRIFFLDSGRLMADSSPSGEDLYEYNVNAPAGSRLTDLTVDPHTGRSADVRMVLGASEDGSYVYFAASGALAPGAVEGECVPASEEWHGGSCNLYVRHEGVTQLVAVLPGNELYDWETVLHGGGSATGLYARVSPNGRWLAFMSAAELTGYDTLDAVSGQPDTEVYLYHAAAGSGEAGALICASCVPTGARPVGELGGEIPGTQLSVQLGLRRAYRRGQASLVVVAEKSTLFISRDICRILGGCSSIAMMRWCHRTRTAPMMCMSMSPKVSQEVNVHARARVRAGAWCSSPSTATW